MVWWIIKNMQYYKLTCYNCITVQYYKCVLVTSTHSLSLPVQSQIFLHHFLAASKTSEFFVHREWCKISPSSLMAKDWCISTCQYPFPSVHSTSWLGEPLLFSPVTLLFCYSHFKTLNFWVFQSHSLHLHDYELKSELSHVFFWNFYTQNKNILCIAG